MRKRVKVPSPIGVRLRRLRKKADVSAREVDRLADLNAGHTSLIETVLGDRISAQTLVPIARVLGVTLDWLATGDGKEPSAVVVCAAVTAARAAAAKAA